MMEYLSDYLWGAFTEFHSAFLGIIIVLVVLFIPRGLMAVSQEVKSRGWGSLGIILKSNIQRFKV